MTQRYSSAATSLKQVPAIYKKVAKLGGWDISSRNLDLGGGKYDLLTEILRDSQVENVIIDPYNRTQIQNNAARLYLSHNKVDSCTISNVLNVIKEPAVREELLWDARFYLYSGGKLYITVYEGDRSSRGRRTSKGWQCNRPLKNYLREVRRVFPGAQVKGGMIVATRPDRYA